MAVNKVVYGNDTLIDITDTTATASDVSNGKYFYAADGTKTAGTASGTSSGRLTEEEYQEATDDVDNILNGVTVPSGTLAISENGIYDVTNYLSANVNVSQSGGTSISESDVNFYDYDGTLIDSYTSSEFLALTVLPSNPTHSGLTAQGWNWSLSDAKTYVNTYGKLNIGQMYVTDDGKTRIYIHLEEGRLEPYLGFAVNGSVLVDWGDGNTETVTGNSTSTVIYTQHTYSSAGDYVIKLSSSNIIYLLGSSTLGSCVLTKNSSTLNENIVYQNSIRKVELGTNVTSLGGYAFYNCSSLSGITIPSSVTSIEQYTFAYCYSLKNIIIPSEMTSISQYTFYFCFSLTNVVIPNSVTSIGVRTFYYCYSLTSIIIPSGVTSIGLYTFCNCYSLTSIIIPSGVTSIGTYAFQGCYSLSSITIPSGITSIGNNTFNGCYSLSSVIIPSGVTSIGNNAFNGCCSLSSIIIPNSVTSIGTYAFYHCYPLSSVTIPSGVTSIETYVFNGCSGMKKCDFSAYTTIPTLSNTNAFTGISSDCQIVVPDSLYEDWIIATNWSNYASYIVKASEA